MNCGQLSEWLWQPLQARNLVEADHIGLLKEILAYFIEHRLQLAQDTLASREKAYALTKRMFEIGSTSGLVLVQNLSTVETARADVAAFTAQKGLSAQEAEEIQQMIDRYRKE